jgi:hypothetical protein
MTKFPVLPLAPSRNILIALPLRHEILVGAEHHHRQLARLVNDMRMFNDLVPLQRAPKEEP